MSSKEVTDYMEERRIDTFFKCRLILPCLSIIFVRHVLSFLLNDMLVRHTSVLANVRYGLCGQEIKRDQHEGRTDTVYHFNRRIFGGNFKEK